MCRNFDTGFTIERNFNDYFIGYNYSVNTNEYVKDIFVMD